MKFTSAVLAATVASASANSLPIFGKPKAGKPIEFNSLKVDSKAGNTLMSHARRVEGDDEGDISYVLDYSIKFQGCHHISQWNEEADGEDEVKVQTKRLVRFRLCPTDSCTYEDAGGCDSGYGDYIIDMNVFLEAYYQWKVETQEWQCEYVMANICDCEDGDDKDDNFNPDYCEYDCYMDRGMDFCVEDNPYVDDDNDEEEFDVEQYMECANFDFPDDGRRRLDQEEVQYFIGPYCASQGGKVYLGVFTDEACTIAADDEMGKTTYYTGMGDYLPYSRETLIDMECMSCKEPEDADQQNQNDQQDEDEINQVCEEVYKQAGKCEKNTGFDNANNNACNYISGIKIVRQDGVVVQGGRAKSKTASVWIGIFAASFILLGAYVYYLKTKLDRAKINLSE